MSNYNGKEQEWTYSHPEIDNRKQKMKPLTAFVQIAFDGPNNGPVKVELSQNCSTVAEHADFLLEKINESQGNLIGLQLSCPVILAAILKENVVDDVVALLDHNIPMEMDSKYTFKFKLDNWVWIGQEADEENGPEAVNELATKMTQLAEKMEDLKKLVDEKLEKMVEEQTKFQTNLAKQQATNHAIVAQGVVKCQAQMDQLKDEKSALKKLMEREAEKVAKLGEEQAKQQGRMEELEKQEKTEVEKHKIFEMEKTKAKPEKMEVERMESVEFACLIRVPIVANLQAHYDRQKLLQLLEQGGNTIIPIPSIYIQSNQKVKDMDLLQSIVDLLDTTERPQKLVKEVTIECGGAYFTWPKRAGLILKDKTTNLALILNEATKCPSTFAGTNLVEYELTN